MRKTVITCDFCGKEIENEIDMITLSTFRSFTPYDPNDISALYNKDGTVKGPEMTDYDICADCLTELQSHIKDIGEESKKKAGK